MKNTQKGFVVPFIIAIVALLAIGSGVYVFEKNKPAKIIELKPEINNTQSATTTRTIADVKTSTTTKTTATSTKKVITQSSLTSCTAEVKSALAKFSQSDDLRVKYVSGLAFTNTVSAKDYLLSKGFKNETGHSSQDLVQTPNATDIGVVLISLSAKFGPDLLETSQPLICFNGKLANNSKEFFAQSLSDIGGARLAIYFKVGSSIVESQLPSTCIDQQGAVPVITSISSSSGPVGTKLQIGGCNFNGFEGDLNVWIKNAQGTSGILYSEPGSTAKSMSIILKPQACQTDESYRGMPCASFLNLVPGTYKIYTMPWGNKSNEATFTIK